MLDSGRCQVRLLSRDDFGDWSDLWLRYQSFYKIEIPPEVTQTTFARLLDPIEPMSGAVAAIGERMVGIVHFIMHRSTWTTGDYCYLQDLFTADDVRGKGVGRALIEYVYARAADAGCSRVYWLTHETNTTAMLLYDRIAQRSGFVQYRKNL